MLFNFNLVKSLNLARYLKVDKFFESNTQKAFGICKCRTFLHVTNNYVHVQPMIASTGVCVVGKPVSKLHVTVM